MLIFYFQIRAIENKLNYVRKHENLTGYTTDDHEQF